MDNKPDWREGPVLGARLVPSTNQVHTELTENIMETGEPAAGHTGSYLRELRLLR
jgi:hypothetical protein